MTSDRTYNMVVLVKQVPDTHNITGDVMKEDGTINRSALPAMFNPEDLNALEMALQVKERYGGTVTVLTMGPPSAAEVLREALYRGADHVLLLTDRRFAGADTLATSYTLKCAIEKLGGYDLVFCGRQAIDGDTAQVGPQTAEKLGIPQITYAESDRQPRRRRDRGRTRVSPGHGMGQVQAALPADRGRFGQPPAPAFGAQADRIQAGRDPARIPVAVGQMARIRERRKARRLSRGAPISKFPSGRPMTWALTTTRLGLAGSPTQVYKVNFVVLETTESKEIPANHEGIAALIQELVKEYIVG